MHWLTLTHRTQEEKVQVRIAETVTKEMWGISLAPRRISSERLIYLNAMRC